MVSITPVEACSRWGYWSDKKTFRNRLWMGLACFLPCRPSRDNASKCRRASTMSRREGPWLGSTGLPASAEKNSRYPRISAGGRCRWEAEIARREKHRRRARCNRKNVPRCKSIPRDLRRRAVWAERRNLPDCQPGPGCEKSPLTLRLEFVARGQTCRHPSWV